MPGPVGASVLRAVGLAALTGGAASLPPARRRVTLRRQPARLCQRARSRGVRPASPSAGHRPPGPGREVSSPVASAKKSASSRPQSGQATQGAQRGRLQGAGRRRRDLGRSPTYVVTQPTKGDFKAFSKICTHRQCTVAAVRDGMIHCNCHGSEFSIKDGSVVHDPAPKPLPEAKVTGLRRQGLRRRADRPVSGGAAYAVNRGTADLVDPAWTTARRPVRSPTSQASTGSPTCRAGSSTWARPRVSDPG